MPSSSELLSPIARQSPCIPRPTLEFVCLSSAGRTFASSLARALSLPTRTPVGLPFVVAGSALLVPGSATRLDRDLLGLYCSRGGGRGSLLVSRLRKATHDYPILLLRGLLDLTTLWLGF